jgi:hypothetical protein
MKIGAAKNAVILSLSKDLCVLGYRPESPRPTGKTVASQRSFDKLRMTALSMAQSIVILLTANG